MRLCLCNTVFRYKCNHQIFWLIYKHFIHHDHNRDVLIVSICFCFYTTLCNIYPHWIILKEPMRDCTLTVCICALRSSRCARIKTENMRSKLRPLTCISLILVHYDRAQQYRYCSRCTFRNVNTRPDSFVLHERESACSAAHPFYQSGLLRVRVIRNPLQFTEIFTSFCPLSPTTNMFKKTNVILTTRVRM